MRKFLATVALCAAAATVSAQDARLSRIEYFFDEDPGYGKGVQVTSVGEGLNVFELNAKGLDDGVHTLLLRAQDKNGLWSTVVRRVFYVQAVAGSNLSAIEYFFDEDPGYGKGIQVTAAKEGKNVFELNTKKLDDGVHTLLLRAQDKNGLWSTIVRRVFYVQAVAGSNLSVIEYFFDEDPGVGKGSKAALSSNAYGSHDVIIPVETLEPGAHLLCLRSQDNHGLWSTAVRRVIYVKDTERVSRAEYFIDEDPGVGNASRIPVEALTGNSLTFNVPTNMLEEGEHNICVRLYINDEWVTSDLESFIVTLAQNSSLSCIEYFFDEDPGYGKGIHVTAAKEGKNVFELNTKGLDDGMHTLLLRVQDKDGLWSTVVRRVFYVQAVAGSNLSAIEYFFDEDPGYGKGIHVTAAKEGKNVFELNTKGLDDGVHTLLLRAQDEKGLWSTVVRRVFYVQAVAGSNLSAIEYFFDEDPGVGKGSKAALSSNAYGSHDIVIPVETLEPGAHLLCLRSQDNHGLWSTAVRRVIYVMNAERVSRAEYFIDEDPGVGNATQIPVETLTGNSLTFDVPTDMLEEGDHNLYVRFCINDNWVTTAVEPFIVTVDAGIHDLTLAMPVVISLEKGGVRLERQEADAPYSIKVCDLSGKVYAHEQWNRGETSKSITLPGAERNSIHYIITCTDNSTGKRLVKMFVP